MDDFLGISDVVASHELDEQDIKELERRKAEASDSIQTHLANIFKGALEQASKAKEEHQEHVKRLEGKKRKVDGGASAAGGHGGARPPAQPERAEEPTPATAKAAPPTTP
eukprot:3785045-Pyramimonas_sp.AAC.1